MTLDHLASGIEGNLRALPKGCQLAVLVAVFAVLYAVFALVGTPRPATAPTTEPVDIDPGFSATTPVVTPREPGSANVYDGPTTDGAVITITGDDAPPMLPARLTITAPCGYAWIHVLGYRAESCPEGHGCILLTEMPTTEPTTQKSRR